MPRQLQMVWPEGLKNVPEPVVPEEYEIRPLRDGDEAGQVAVMRGAGFEQWSEEKLANWRDRFALPNGIFVAVHRKSDKIVATAMASHRPSDLHPGGGELGWVAASGDHSGKGLGKAVCAAVMRRYVRAGYQHVYLNTDDFRLAAIKTYLKMGFLPFLFSPDMEQRWRKTCEQLNWPFDLESCVRAPRERWLPVHNDDRPDADRVERYAPRHQWLPNRSHRGFSCHGDVDAFGDESLYKPSRLGSARAEPNEVEAGAESPLALVFTAGPDGVPENASVIFVMRGQKPLGNIPSFTLTHSGSCELEAKNPGFVVKKGELKEGETATLRCPTFQWTPLAARREFKVVINYDDGGPERRLPEPVVVTTRPQALARFAATLPCTRPPGKTIDVNVTARDEHDNRVPFSGEVKMKTSDGDERPVRLENGLGTARWLPTTDAPARVEISAPDDQGTRTSNPCLSEGERQLYVGDLHCHDFMSEAEGYPDEIYRWAIEDQRLDFVSIVPQCHGWLDNETWAVAKYMNERFLNEGEFVTLLGFEWQHTGYGDKIVHYLGGDQPFLPVDDLRYHSAAGLYEALRGSDALVVSHHPCYPPGTWCCGTDFESVETDVERLVEIWSMHGSSEGYDPTDRPFAKFDPSRQVMPALKRGVRLGFTAGSDSHSGRPGGSAKEPRRYWGGLTAIWAESLTRRDLFQALRERRTYALTRARIILNFSVNGHPMGAEASAAEVADINIDAWAPSPIEKVEVIKNASLLRRFTADGEEHHVQLEDETNGAAFYHCRVTLKDGDLAVCSPVWLG